MHDWFAPLDGCPRCGYPYEREPGYFLMSIWAINYGFGAVFAVALYGIYEWFFAWSILKLLMATIIPLALFNFAFARHSKAIFLAFDLFCDPHEKKGGGDDGGNRLAVPPLDGNSPQRGAPLPASPEPPVLVGLRKDS